MQFTIQAYVVLLPLFGIWWIVVHRLRQTGSIWWSREQFLARLAFAVYIAAVASITLFPIHVHTGEARDVARFHNSVSIVPFQDLQLVDFLLNVAMLVPLGVGMGIFRSRPVSFPVALFVGYVVGASIELLQLAGRIWVANDRFVTINDVIANALGVGFGILIFRLASRRPAVAMQLEWLRNVD